MTCSDSFFGFKAYCEALIEEGLEEALAKSSAAEPMLSAARHAVFPKGKRIRPLLSLFLCRDCGGDVKKLLPAALSLELVHCASLVHDDLPAIDNDDYRRGRPSCHKAYGEATAVLTGDFLIALAQKLVLEADLPSTVVIEIARLLSDAFLRVCSGQQLDLQHGKDRVSLTSIHTEKTGALFETCCKMALLASGANKLAVENAGHFGLSLGFLFQIVDDYVDIFGSSRDRGKPVSSDCRNRKETFFNCANREDGFKAYGKALEQSQLCLDRLIAGVRPGAEFSGTRFIVELVCSRIRKG